MTNTENFSTASNFLNNESLGDAITPNIPEDNNSLELNTTSKGAFSDPLRQQLETFPTVSTAYDILDSSEIENAEISTGSTSDGTIFVDPEPLEGDADSNRHLNFDDVQAIFANRNTDAIGENDVRDLDDDGKITVLDGRKLVVIIRGNKDKNAPNLSFGLDNDTTANHSTNDDFITSDPTISGVIEDFSQITSLTARFDNTSIEDTTETVSVLNEDGSFILNKTQLEAINGSPLDEGEHTLYLQAKDKWGNQTELVSVNFILDTTAPQIDVSDLIKNPQINSDSLFTGTVDEELASLTYSFEKQETVEVDVDGLEFGQSFNLTDLGEGTNTLTITATDLAGNVTTQTLDVEISLAIADTTPPEIKVVLVNDTGSSAGDFITSDPTIIGIVNDESEIASLSAGFNDSLADITSALQSDGSFNLSEEILQEINSDNPLADGEYTLYLVATDIAGNESTTAVNFTLDTTESLLSASLITDTGSNSNDGLTNNPTVSGNVTDANEITSLSASLGDVDVNITNLLQADGSFTVDEDALTTINEGNQLADGEYTLNLVATDAAGNKSVSKVSFTLDTTAPELAVGEPVANSNLADDNQLTGTVDEDLASLVYRFNDGEEVEVDLTNGAFNQALDLAGLTDGDYTLTLIASDKAGNVTEEIIAVNLDTVPDDTTAPIINVGLVADTGSSSKDNLTSNPEISGSVSDESAIPILRANFGGNNVDITSLINADGNFILDAAKLAEINGSALEDGDYTLNITAVDEFGNESIQTIAFALDTTEALLSADLVVDSGSNGNDGLTNNPTISGSVTDVNAIASLTANLNNIDLDIIDLVNADGNFILDAVKLVEINGNNLIDGDYILNLVATDAAGNESTTAISFTLDTTAPELSINEPLANSNLADNNQFTGTVDEDLVSLVYRFNDGDAIEVELTNNSFAQALDLAGLPEGENSLTLVATDKAGNVTEEIITVNLDTIPDDTTAPVINVGLVADTGNSSEDNLTSNPTFSGTVTDDTAIALLTANLGGDDVNILDLIDADGSFTLDTAKLVEINNGNNLADGEYTLNLTTTDEAGNESVSTVSFTLDTTAPELSISEPLANSNLADNKQLTGTVDEDLSSLAYRLNDGEEVEVDLTNGAFDQTLDIAELADGDYTLTLIATDKAGNVTEEIITVNLDTAPDDTAAPIINLGLVADTGNNDQDGITKNPEISGSVSDESEIASLTANLGGDDVDISDLIDADGNFTLDEDALATINDSNNLADGEYTLNLAAADKFGNESVKTISFTLDTTEASLSADLVADTGGNSNDGLTNNPAITGSVSDESEIASLTANLGGDDVDISDLIDANGNFSLDTAKLAEINGSNLADREYTLDLVATDAAGNESVTSVNFTLDTTAPELTVSEPVANSNLADNKQLTGTVDEDLTSLVYRLNNGDEIEVDLTNGAFDQTLDIAGLADRDYTLTLIATDKAGNVTEETITVNLDTTPDDVTAPLINAGLVLDTGSNGSDGITFDAEIFGNITDESDIATLTASLDGVNFIDVSDRLATNGTNFSLDADALATINNGVSLEDGEYTLELIATDAVGNESELTTVPFTLDTIAPELVINEPAEASILTIGSELSGTVDEELSTLSYHFNDGQDIDIELADDGSFVQDFDLAGLAEGENELTITAIDKAGNVSEETFTVQVTFSEITLGQTVSDTISATDISDVFIINAEVGQRIYFDGLDDDNNFNTFVRLTSPSGQVIISSQNTETNRAPITLTETGAYQVQVQGNVTETEAYSFRILDVAAASELTLGEVTEGTLTDGSSTELFSFTAEAGQQFFLDGQGDFHNGSYVIYNAANGFETSQTFGFDREFTLDEAGEYILAVAGNNNDDAQDYRFNLIASDINTQFLTIGEIVTDGLEEAGEEDLYLFSGSVGQRLLFDGIDSDSTMGSSLISPSGINIFSSHNVRSDRTPVTLTEDGVYQLKIDSNSGNTGDYSFQVLDLASASELTLGEAISSTLANANTIDLFSFTAEAGQKFFLDGQDTFFNGTYTIYNAANQQIVNQNFGFDSEFTIDNAGTYILAARGNSDTDLTYRFNLIAHESDTETLVFGETITGEITPVGDDDLYSFTGSVGQRIYFDGLSNDASSSAYLISPNGQRTSLTSTASDTTPRTLTETGTYQIQIDNNGDNTGAYSFRVLNLASATDLTLGDVTTGTLNDPNSTDLFTFTAEAGQRFFLDGQGTFFNGTYIIYNAANQFVVNQNFGFDREFTIDNAGTYILAARGSSGTDLTYSFNLIAHESTTETLVFGETVTGEITPAGDDDLYSFTGSVGQRIYFDGLTNDASSSAFLISPNGQRTSLTSTASDSTPRTLTEAGTYQIQIDNSGDNTGAYSFRILDFASATDLTLGNITIGTLSDSNTTDLFTFTAEAGQKFFLDGQGTRYNGRYVIYNAANQSVVNRNFGFDQEFTIENAGTYILTARGNSDMDLTYSFNLIAHESTTDSLVFGETVTGEITPAGDDDLYSFTGSVGQRIYFDGLTNDASSFAYLTNPSGQRTYLTGTASDSTPRTLTEAGTYQIQIDNNGDTTGAYSFRVLDSNNASSIALTDNVRGDLAARTTDVYRFEAQAGQTIELDGTGVSGATYTIYNAANQSIGSVSSNSNREFEIAIDGTYFVYAQNNSDSAINGYEFNLTQTAFEEPDPIVATPLTLGAVISETISVADEEDIYTFEGTVGQTLYFDGISTSPTIYTSLISPSGQTLYSFQNVGSDRAPLTLTEAGTYQLEIDGSGATTGDYSFRLLDGADATKLTLDTETTGTLAESNTTNLYTFDAEAGQRFNLDELSDPDSDVSYFIYDSANQSIVGTSSDLEFTIDDAGTYLLAARGSSTEAADYSFSFNLLTPETTTQELALGNVVSSNISESGEEDIYTFEGTVGQTVYFDGISSDSSVIYSRLISPSGQNVFNSNFHRVDSDRTPVTLTEAGTYQLEIDGNRETTGDYSFRLLDVADATALTPDTETTGTLAVSNTSNLFTFDAQAGERFYFDELSDPDNDVSYTIYNSANQSITGTSSDVEFTIDNAGTYLLAARGSITEAADYSFSFNLITPETTTQELTLGNVVESNIGEPGEEDIYTFEGSVGQTIYFDGISGPNISNGIRNSLITPSGQNLYSSFQNVIRDHTPVTLTEAGTYQLEIDGISAITGDYSFRLLDGADATELILDTETTGTLAESNTTNLYSFDAQAGERFYLDELSDS